MFDDSVKNLSLLIIDYEEGDLIALGEMIDELESVKEEVLKYSPDKGNLYRFSNALISLTTAELNDPGQTNFKSLLSGGVDIINRIAGIAWDLSGHPYIEEDLSAILSKIEHCPALLKQEKQEEKTAGSREDSDTSPEDPVSDDHPEDFSEENGMDEVMTVFITEAEDRLIQAQDMILRLEEEPGDKEAVNILFRTVHTLKGEAGFLKFITLSELTHHLETIFDQIRNDEIRPDDAIIEILFRGIDYCGSIIRALKEEGNEGAVEEIQEFVKSLIEVSSESRTPLGQILQDSQSLKKETVEEIVKEQIQKGFSRKFGEIALERELVSSEAIKESLKKQENAAENKSRKLDPIIKVKASHINYLVDMVGELLIAESQLEDSQAGQLKKITREIHSTAMKLRSTKATGLFINMTRVVRDVSRKLGKSINFSKSGESIEIDRNMIESLDEPLMHILRNAVSHGIEPAAEREKKGKDPAGNISMEVERKGNTIQFSIRDDGRGLNRRKILEKALSLGLADPHSAENLSDRDVFRFIFHPGFSTAEKVDSVSGRGVGMDIVRSTIEQLNGRILMESREGEYTEVNLVFPLSMAIIDGMVVRCGRIYFIVPVANIIETFSVNDEMIHSVESRESVIHLRNEVFPVIDLKSYFNLVSEQVEKHKLAVIIEANGAHYALFVDEILSKREVVIKNLGAQFRQLPGISSGTVLPGGDIGFVLNIDDVISTQ